ncbi:zinc transport system ATP-binding protein [Lachnospiraceae bacterium XBB1006]|nr:zinc transport system ATP-binding protein [Lachnospiraceae bacterium XBB1006]
MKLIKTPCGLHCIKIIDFGVKFANEPVFEHVDLHVHCGTLTVLIGENGAGKSTLVRAILGEIPHTGKLEFRDRKDGELQKIRIGYVPQKLNIEKNTPVSVYDMMASYHSKVPVFLYKSPRLRKKILEALSQFEAEELIDQQVCNLSGGQLQRVLLAMAVMGRPHLLLLDEPISGVDMKGSQLFYKTIDEMKKKFDMAIILISHDMKYVAKYADHVVLLDHGIVTQGKVGQVFKSPEFERIFGKGEWEHDISKL